MQIACRLSRFFSSAEGAVTVDWVVLAAALVGLAIATGVVFEDDLSAIAESQRAGMEAAPDIYSSIAEN